jgi:selenocysteine lyase/cysteine desulfurase
MMSTSIDVARARRETPGCERVLHFNNAGAALMPESVIAAVTGHLEREAQTGGYEAADEADNAIERVYDSAARLLGGAAAGLRARRDRRDRARDTRLGHGLLRDFLPAR